MFLIIGCSSKDEGAESKSTDKAESAAESVEATFASIEQEYIAEAEKIVADWKTMIRGLEGQKSNLSEIAQKPLEDSFESLAQLASQVQR